MSYKGQVAEIPVGQGGLSGSRNQTIVRPDQLVEATNISMFAGTMDKAGGATKYNTTVISGAPNILGGYDWFPDTATQRMVVLLSDGTYKKDDGSGTFATTLASTLTVSNINPFFVTAGKEVAANNRKLFLFTGPNAVKVLSGDGVTAASLATPPADWTGTTHPTFGAFHEGRLWGGGNGNDPHRLYYSTTSNHEDFTSAGSGSISVFPGEGEKLVGAVSFKGLLVVFKYPVGIYLIDTSNATASNWRVTRLTTAIGAASIGGQVLIDDDLLFLDAAGNFQLISAVTEFGDMSNKNISQSNNADMNQFMRDNINLGRLSSVQGVYYSGKREAIFTFSQTSSTNQDRRIVVDFNQANITRFHFQDRDINTSIWMRKHTDNVLRPIIGDNAGFVWKLDQSTKNKDGASYSSEFQTASMDLSHIDPSLGPKKKNGQFLELVAFPTGNWNVFVDIIWDDQVVQTVAYNMGTTGAALGTFVIGTDSLAAQNIITRRKRITGGGRRFAIKVRNNGLNEDYSLSKFFLEFEVADERTKS